MSWKVSETHRFVSQSYFRPIFRYFNEIHLNYELVLTFLNVQLLMKQQGVYFDAMGGSSLRPEQRINLLIWTVTNAQHKKWDLEVVRF